MFGLNLRARRPKNGVWMYFTTLFKFILEMIFRMPHFGGLRSWQILENK